MDVLMDFFAIVCKSRFNESLIGTIGCNNSDLTSLARLDAALRSLWYESSLLLNDSLQHDSGSPVVVVLIADDDPECDDDLQRLLLYRLQFLNEWTSPG
jgi:hypothetical protein